jgi:hypothetical protein
MTLLLIFQSYLAISGIIVICGLGYLGMAKLDKVLT